MAARGARVAPPPSRTDRSWLGGRVWTGAAAIALLAMGVLVVAIGWIERPGRHDARAVSTTTATSSAPAQLPAVPTPVPGDRPVDAASTGPRPAPGGVPGRAPGGTASRTAPGTALRSLPGQPSPGATASGRGTPTPAATAEAVPSGPPADITWQAWRTIALPYSRQAGPATVVGDVASGFAHTPTGALLAAVQASSRKVAAGETSWRLVSTAMLAPGPGRDAWMAARARVTLAADPAPGTFAQVAGFQFVSYTATDAVVQLASRNADGGFGVVALHLTWLDGDWRLVLAPDGSDATAKLRATSLDGFIAWGGV